MCYFHHNPLYACKNTIFLLNISSFLSSDLDSPFLLACYFSTLEFHHVLFVCLILRMLQLFEFSHILFQDRRTGISDFRAICCTVLQKKKKKNHFNTDKEYVPCQGLLAVYFRMKNSSFLYCQVSHRKNTIYLLIFCLFEKLLSLKWTQTFFSICPK